MSASNHRWLVMRLEAPLMAFGGVAIDHIGVTRDFPAASMMTGLLASALGCDRTDWEKHQRLQDRLVFAACRDREARKGRLTDTQNAKLQKNDKGWTTRGSVETRGGDKGKMDAPHRRRRDFHMDTRVIVVLRLAPDDTHPTLDDIANALDHPARPLFPRAQALPARPAVVGGGCPPLRPFRHGPWRAFTGIDFRKQYCPRAVARGGRPQNRRGCGPHCRSSGPQKLAHRNAWRRTHRGGGPNHNCTGKKTMNRLLFVRLAIDLMAFGRVAAQQGLPRDEGLAMHHMLAETFGKAAVQPFRLMHARNGGQTGTLYGYTTLPDAQLLEAAGTFAVPETADVFDLRTMRAKPMPQRLPEGMRLGFDVHVRPVRKTPCALHGWSREAHRRVLNGKPPGFIAKGAEVDAFLLERLRDNPGEPADRKFQSEGRTREAVYLDWLAERLVPAAKLDKQASRVRRIRRRKVFRNGKPVNGPDATVHGEMTVRDPAAMMILLSKGVGRHTAYGYGMLLLRPPARR